MEPLTCCVPDQPPLAVQAVASWLAQVSVVLAPAARVLGTAVSETVGS